MNTNPKSKSILLYGDSFVFGKVGGENKRLDVKIRFSGVLQDTLGIEYDVIEEGLRARTLSGENGFFEDRDGLKQFGPILGSHLPLNLIIILLGTNDFNSKSHKDPNHAMQDLKAYQQEIQVWAKFLEVPMPKILLVAPPAIKTEYFDEGQREIFGEKAQAKISQIAEVYRKSANELEWEFLNANDICEASTVDGVHLDDVNNRMLGEALSKLIRIIV